MQEPGQRNLHKTPSEVFRGNSIQAEAGTTLQARVKQLEEEIETLRTTHNASDALVKKLLAKIQRMKKELSESSLQRTQLEISLSEEQQKVTNEQQKAAKDDLTGVLRRHAFYETVVKIREGMAREKRSPMQKTKNCAVMMIDIDKFKSINDEHGHLVGDEALKALVEQLREKVRTTDVIGRWGGEEFVIFFPAAEVEEIYHKLIKDEDGFAGVKVSFESKISQKSLEFTVSGGIAPVAPDDDLLARIKQADEILYKAKKEGRNQILEVVE